jgi:hypothetical protein
MNGWGCLALPLLAPLTLWLAVKLVMRGERKWSRWRRGQCPACGYDLRHFPERCPECGRRYRWRDHA